MTLIKKRLRFPIDNLIPSIRAKRNSSEASKPQPSSKPRNRARNRPKKTSGEPLEKHKRPEAKDEVKLEGV